MTDQIPTFQNKAFAFAKEHRRWLLAGFFTLCFLSTIRSAPTATDWRAFTILLLGAAAIGHTPYVYKRLSLQRKTALYGGSAISIFLLLIFWIAGPGQSQKVEVPPQDSPQQICEEIVKNLVNSPDIKPKIIEIDDVSSGNTSKSVYTIDVDILCYGQAITAIGPKSIEFGVKKSPQDQEI